MFLPRLNARSALVSYMAVTAVLAFPLLRHLASLVPSDPADPVLNAWILWWNTQAIPFTERWWSPPVFYPLPNTLAFSEHLFGISLLSTPVYWLTGSPVVAYNVAFLLTFPLSGLAAYWLGLELTGRRDAAWIAGLAFAFAPYRMDQLAHIQVLASYWMPLALLGLHRFYRDGRFRWLALFGLSTLMQGLSNGYYLLFFPVLVLLWVLWFTPNEGWWRKVSAVGVVGALFVLPLVPVLLKYRAVHESLGLTRASFEIQGYSADVAAFLSASPYSTLWGFLETFRQPEGQLFPGLTLVGLLAVALWRIEWRPRGPEPRALKVLRAIATVTAVGFVVGLAVRVIGPWELGLNGWKIAIPPLEHAIPQAVLACVVALILSRAGTWAYRRHSPFAFYLLAAFLLAVLSLGPHPTLLGSELMSHSPYLVLMQLPGFESLRVPARFWMVALVCLSAVAGLAFARLVPRGGRPREVALAVVTLGFLADGWVSFPTVPAPGPSVVLEQATGPVVELPLGWRDDDVAAMLRSAAHGQPVVNGYSGYPAPHYLALRYGLGRGNDELLAVLGGWGVRHIRIDRTNGRAPHYESLVASSPALRLVAETATESLYEFRAPPVPSEPYVRGPRLPLAGVTANVNPDRAAFVDDGDLRSRWHTGQQTLGHELRIDLGSPRRVGAVVMRLGSYTFDFPRELLIEVSHDDVVWKPVWRGPTDTHAMVAGLLEPSSIPLVFPLHGREARYIRLRQTSSDATFYWSIAELSVVAPPP